MHPGGTVRVTLTVEPPEGTSTYAVREVLPGGWVVSDISNSGAFDYTPGAVKWRFSSEKTRQLTYRIRAPVGASGSHTFSGEVLWEGGARAIGGDTSIQVIPRDRDPPTGQEILKAARRRPAPLGISALKMRSEGAESRSLRKAVRDFNQWARDQVESFERAPTRSGYRQMLRGLVEGDRGLRALMPPSQQGAMDRPVWLSPWTEQRARHLGKEGFGQLTAFLRGFVPGSEAVQFVFGGRRAYDPEKGTVFFQGAEVEAVGRSGSEVPSAVNGLEKVGDPRALVRYARGVREAIFSFYESFQAGGVGQEEVGQFNRALVLAGGRSLVNWDTPLLRQVRTEAFSASRTRALQSELESLNRMAGTLSELGISVEVGEEGPDTTGSDALASLVNDDFSAVATDSVRGPGLAIASGGHLPTAKVGTPYVFSLKADGGRSPLVWSVVEGILPDGVRLDPERGRIVGAPQEEGLFNATLAVEGDDGQAAKKRVVLPVQTATAGILIAKTKRTYDGEPKPVSVATDPRGLEVSVTYGGSDEPPTAPGKYRVSVRIISKGYRGSAETILHIQKPGSEARDR